MSKFSLRNCDLDKLNSMTKYPSIPTYHALGNKGILLEETIEFPEEIILTEKVDGTNSRIILLPDGNFVLGSREELLFAKGDLIGNPALGIVEALKDVASTMPRNPDSIAVLFLELYGGKITAASKQYTSQQSVGWRLFDIAVIDDFESLFEKSTQQLASWRNNGGQSFFSESKLQKAAKNCGIELTPRLGVVQSLPSAIGETFQFLKDAISKTSVALDDGALGRPEGIVARTASRSAIAKLRFEDYQRSVRFSAK